jgi:hypothetical protein
MRHVFSVIIVIIFLKNVIANFMPTIFYQVNQGENDNEREYSGCVLLLVSQIFVRYKREMTGFNYG